jgi:hypothetical protein
MSSRLSSQQYARPTTIVEPQVLEQLKAFAATMIRRRPFTWA